MAAKDQMRRLHWHFSKEISSSRRGGPVFPRGVACLEGVCTSPLVPGAPPRSSVLLAGAPTTPHPALGCEISQRHSSCQLVVHVGDVSIFTAERNRFQVPQPLPERRGPPGANATSGALGEQGALPATALIAVIQGAAPAWGGYE